jgi:O-methyltransferase
MYEKVSIGGYIIMDDWYGFPAKKACEDFFQVHKISPTIIQIDSLGVYWQKTADADVHVQHWRYSSKKFRDT